MRPHHLPAEWVKLPIYLVEWMMYIWQEDAPSRTVVQMLRTISFDCWTINPGATEFHMKPTEQQHTPTGQRAPPLSISTPNCPGSKPGAKKHP